MTQTPGNDSAVLGTGSGAINSAAVLGGEKGFEKALAHFVSSLQEMVDKHFEGSLKNLKPNQISIDPGGKKYVRIVSTTVHSDGSNGQRSVHCFVNKENGDILMAATWKAPAKHPRGNIYQPNAMDAVTVHGAKYLK